MAFLAAILLILVLFVSLLMTVVGLPGNWVMVTAAALYAYIMPSTSRADFGWPVVLALVILAAVGELLELAAGALGVARSGGSRRGAVMALAGSILGALIGMTIGLPIPLIGSLLAALLFAGVGALIGAMLGEHTAGRGLGDTWRIGKAAFWGRLLGTLSKSLVGVLMLAAVVIALIV